MHVEHNVPKTTYLKNYEVSPYLIDRVELSFDLFDEETQVISRLRVSRHPHSMNQDKQLILDGEDLVLISVSINQEVLNPSQYQQTPHQLMLNQVPDQFDLEIVTRIFPQKNTALSGLYRSSQTYCTQCESQGFRRITYFLDRPDVLSRYTVKITADKKRYPALLSNGNLIETGDVDGGRHFAIWEDPFKKPCYLFALVAGDFDLLQDTFITQSKRMIDLRIYVDKGYGDQAHHALYALKAAMRWDENTYGREYDLDTYMIVAIGDFNMGAMENKGLNIFNTKYVLAKPETAVDNDYIHILSVVGHEYFHNWSGNRVTCRDWFQLSLKEGLTIFRDQTFSEDELSPSVMRIREVNYLREVQFSEDAGPLSHPVRPDSYIEIDNFYTATVYNKGAEVLRMLRTIIGKALFRKGMDLYFEKYDGQAVTIEDYISAMETVSNQDFTQFKRWYHQAGTPQVDVIPYYDEDKKIFSLTFNQSCPATPNQPEKLPFVIPIDMALLNEQGESFAENLFSLISPSQTLAFENITDKPIPSLLRNFSAPVKIHYPYTQEELLFLSHYDTDDFNRFDAGERYVLHTILQLINDTHIKEELIVSSGFLKRYVNLFERESKDPLLLSEMLSLPSEKYIGDQMKVVDVDGIHRVREFLLNAIAQSIETVASKTYSALNQINPNSVFNIQDIGKRDLKNKCLAYLMRLPTYREWGERQFKQALKINMTDTLAALTFLSRIDCDFRKEALQQFYDTYKQDTLVIDKWLAIQADSQLSSALTDIKKLVHHEAFDIKNPNKVYALIGTFGHRNALHFHAKSGEGYAFLTDMVMELDQLNPQIAARMIKPLTAYKRYDKERQSLMYHQLTRLLERKLSADLYELVIKSLE